jgi:prepilin-type N-terminal cleavage/methylation domain-containing protein
MIVFPRLAMQPKQTKPSVTPARRGFSFLEFLVAMVVLGIALTGLFPLMVICSRGVESLELRYTDQGNKNGNWFSPVFRPNTDSVTSRADREDYGTWYLNPPADPWARKLGAVATFSRTAPAPSPAPIIVDDGSNGYSTTGAWSTAADPNAFLSDQQRHESQATPTDAALWTFTNVANGRYYVMATWHAATDLAADARFDVYDGDNVSTPTTTAFANQAAAPNSSVYAGWQILTTWNFTNADKIIKVKLSSNTAAAVVADGVRVVPVATILSVDKSFNDQEVTIRVKIGP